MGRILRTIVAIVISILWISISAFLFLNMASYKIVCKKSTGNCILAKKTTLEKTYTKYKEIPIASIKNAVLKKEERREKETRNGKRRTRTVYYYTLCFETSRAPICTFYNTSSYSKAIETERNFNRYLQNSQNVFELTKENNSGILAIIFILIGFSFPFIAYFAKPSTNNDLNG